MKRIEFSSIYGLETRQPMIHFKWGSEEGVLTITEARAHALAVLEVCEAATADAFFFEFVAEKIADGKSQDEKDRAGAAMMKEFRDWRMERGLGVGIDPVDHRPSRAERRRKERG